ncbi:NTE family protein [Candidatus Magnetomoraceae bacterium gMMP-13]
MAYHFRNFVFEGGINGVAYAGVMKALDAKDPQLLNKIQRVAGTSAGAIYAAIFGLNFSLKEIKDILSSLDFNKFLDDSWGVARDTERLINDFGWYKGDFFRNWMAELIAEKTGNSEATFAEIHRQKDVKGFKDLYFIGVNLSTRFSEVFSYEHTPRMCVADAVRISMSIPLFFAAKRSVRGDIYVDGGLFNNYPIKLFDRKKYLITEPGRRTKYYERHNEKLRSAGLNTTEYIYNNETLGFRLTSADEIAVYRDHAEPSHHKINDIFDYSWSLIETIMEMQNSVHLHSDDWHRTVYIDMPAGVKTNDLNLTDKQKKSIDSLRRSRSESLFEMVRK